MQTKLLILLYLKTINYYSTSIMELLNYFIIISMINKDYYTIIILSIL